MNDIKEPIKAKSATKYLDFLLKIKSKDIVPTIVKITINSVEIAKSGLFHIEESNGNWLDQPTLKRPVKESTNQPFGLPASLAKGRGTELGRGLRAKLRNC